MKSSAGRARNIPLIKNIPPNIKSITETKMMFKKVGLSYSLLVMVTIRMMPFKVIVTIPNANCPTNGDTAIM
jgi:hypothetical protein